MNNSIVSINTSLFSNPAKKKKESKSDLFFCGSKPAFDTISLSASQSPIQYFFRLSDKRAVWLWQFFSFVMESLKINFKVFLSFYLFINSFEYETIFFSLLWLKNVINITLDVWNANFLNNPIFFMWNRPIIAVSQWLFNEK